MLLECSLQLQLVSDANVLGSDATHKQLLPHALDVVQIRDSVNLLNLHHMQGGPEGVSRGPEGVPSSFCRMPWTSYRFVTP
jgi:hypothetical protein